jgi:hypothetical protein
MKSEPLAEEARAGTDLGGFTESIGTSGRVDPKDRPIPCRLCGRENRRRTVCATHGIDELRPLIEKAAGEEEEEEEEER